MSLLRLLPILAASPLLFACGHGARVNSAHVSEPGTHLVSTPGALTVVQQNASGTRSCTLRAGHPGKAGKGGRRGGGAAPRGPDAMLDALLFRLCEARANNDITPEQYNASVQSILETMKQMAARGPMQGRMRAPGMRMGQGKGRGRMGPGADGPGMGPGGPGAPGMGPDGPGMGPGGPGMGPGGGGPGMGPGGMNRRGWGWGRGGGGVPPEKAPDAPKGEDGKEKK